MPGAFQRRRNRDDQDISVYWPEYFLPSDWETCLDGVRDDLKKGGFKAETNRNSKLIIENIGKARLLVMASRADGAPNVDIHVVHRPLLAEQALSHCEIHNIPSDEGSELQVAELLCLSVTGIEPFVVG